MIRVAFISCSADSERKARAPWYGPLRERGVMVHACVPDDDSGDVEALREAGAVVHRWPVRRGSLDPLQVRALFDLVRGLRASGCDLMHAFGHRANLSAAMAAPLAGSMLRVGHITGAGSVFTGSRPSLGDRAARLGLLTAWRGILPGMSRLLLDNADDRDLLPFAPADLLLPTRGPGVDTARFSPQEVRVADSQRLRRRLGLREDAEVVLFAGRMIGDKGLAELAAASAMLAKRRPRMVVLLAGGADPANPSALSESEIAALDHPPMRVLGARLDVRELLALAHVFVNPSYREGLPRSNLEAAAMEVPVVSTNARGCRDTVHHGETGLLVPSRDASALAEAIEMLLRDPQRRTAMGRAGRRFVQERFSVELVAEELATLYRSLLNPKRERGRST